jgi:hypothetical protein
LVALCAKADPPSSKLRTIAKDFMAVPFVRERHNPPLGASFRFSSTRHSRLWSRGTLDLPRCILRPAPDRLGGIGSIGSARKQSLRRGLETLKPE